MSLDLKVDPTYAVGLFAGLSAAVLAIEGRRRFRSIAARDGHGCRALAGGSPRHRGAARLARPPSLGVRTLPGRAASAHPRGRLGGAPLPAELNRVRLELERRGLARPAAAAALLAVASVALVSLSDLALLAHGRFVSAPWRNIPLARGAFGLNAALLFTVCLLLLSVTGRVGTTLAIIGPTWLGFTAATLAKLTYLQSAIQPLDVLRVPELLPLLPRMFGTGLLVALMFAAAAGALIAVAVYLRERPWLSPPLRAGVGLACAVLLASVPAVFAASERSPRVRTWLVRAGAPEGQFKEQAKRNGVLLSFASELPSLAVARPHDYSATSARAAAARYAGDSPVTGGRQVNLIVYLIESLMDPADLGVRFTAEPLPNFRALQEGFPGGYAIVPGEFGGSANTEFELLTGMSMGFLPEGSTPYRQYLRRRIPSLPWQLKRLGYTTAAVQPDPRFYYDRERAYGILGFDRVVWLDDVEAIERDGRVGWPADRAVVQAIIDVSRERQPYFIFAFPASTHSYYRSGVFRGSRLEPVSTFPSDSAGEIKEYVNALQLADRAIGALVEHFAARSEPTVIAVLGDHLPPLSTGALAGFYDALAAVPAAEQELRLRRVPLLVWANFPLEPERLTLSVSALPGYLLSALGADGSGILAATDSIRREMPVITRRSAMLGGRMRPLDSLPERPRGMLADYRLIQYDLLLGKQYSLPGGDR